MKYVFLDIDGVLNSSNYLSCDKSPNGFLGLDDELIKIAKPLLTEKDTKIILSSTWRKLIDGDLEWLQKRLKEFDITIDDYTTTSISEDRRDKQIIEYITKHLTNKDGFVIIDDSFRSVFSQSGLSQFFVQTDWKYGITNDDVRLARTILNNKIENIRFIIHGGNKAVNEKRFGR